MDFIIYILKVNIAIMLFYGIFRLLFQKDTFFRWKRFALLSIIFISFLYPAIDITRQIVANHQLKNMLETINIPLYNLPEVIITENTNASTNYFPQILLAIYILVSCFLLIRMLVQVGNIIFKLRNTSKKVLFGQNIYGTSGLKTPFSFFRWIVLDSSQYSETELKEILLHETTHVEQGHSADTLLAELLCVFCWFNPFAWLLKTEIRMNLEFLADRSVLSSGCGVEHYQFHLLRLSYNKAAATITNNFNVSLLKKRIFMMNKKQTSLRSIWKYALILPVIALLLFFNSTFQAKAEPDNTMNIVQTDNETNITLIDNEMNYDLQNPVINKNNREIYSVVEVMPTFPGGENALMRWLSDNIIYPKIALEQGIQGRVSTKFVVTPDGSITDIEITKGVDPVLDKEAIRAIAEMPKWKPGKQNGKPVYVFFNLPVYFQLRGSSSAKSATAPSQYTNAINQTGYNTQNNLIIEIDGKVVSDEEFNKIDPKTIESININKNINPNRLIVKTKK